MGYVTTSSNAHGRDEELQWARVVSADDPAKGVGLIFVQKLCTAFHEFEPAWREGMLNPESLEHFRARLLDRARRVLQVLEANGMATLDGVEELRDLTHMIEDAKSLQALAMLAEPVHTVAHTLTDALEEA